TRAARGAGDRAGPVTWSTRPPPRGHPDPHPSLVSRRSLAMPNAVLARKREERADQLAFVDELLSKVEADGGRDLVDAELKNLEAARQRAQELDAQTTPLEENETMTASHRETAGAYVPQDRPGPSRQAIGRG